MEVTKAFRVHIAQYETNNKKTRNGIICIFDVLENDQEIKRSLGWYKTKN
jgi:hypothetical protein